MSQEKIRIVTTSWDDGDVRDLRIAELLRAHNLRGTFYVPIEPFNGNPSLSQNDLRSLATEGFEIGGHSVGHEIMSQISAEKVEYVVKTCKTVLEDTLGKRVRMFCYPRGRYTPQVVQALRAAGYDGARTVRLLATGTAYGPYDLPTSIQVYPHTRTEYLRNIARAGNLGRLYDYVSNLSLGDDWIAIGKTLFDRVLAEGGIWHLWGHSWEIDQLGLWDQMPEMLDYVSGRPNVLYLNNAELVQYLAHNSN